MRLVHSLKQSAGFSGSQSAEFSDSQSAGFSNLAGIETGKQFTWENSAKTMLKHTGD